MNIENVLKIRRAIMVLEPGASVTIALPGEDPSQVTAEAQRFARGRNMLCAFTMEAAGLLVTRIGSGSGASLYPEIDALKVGASKLYEVPPSLHQRIRLAASNRARAGKVRLACKREGDFIRVTRLPMTDDEAKACGPIQVTARATKYDLERLSTGERLTFTLEPKDHHKVRLAASRAGKLNGWVVRCRLQDDGTMLVYRTDYQPQSHPGAASDATASDSIP